MVLIRIVSNLHRMLLGAGLKLGQSSNDICTPNVLVRLENKHSREMVKLMCNSYSQIMVFTEYLLLFLIVCRLFSLKNLALSLS